MKVKIIKATEINTEENGVVLPWYKNDIGEIFEVSDETTMINGRESYQVIQHNEPSALCIECCDCERVNRI